MNKWLQMLLYLLGAIILTRLIPFSSFFRNLDTMDHEFGHAVVGLLLSGHVQSIELHSDHSGVTYLMLPSAWSSIVASLAGYVGASLFALVMFYLYSIRQYKMGLVVMTGIAAVMIVFFVHHGFGVFWIAGFIAINVLVIFLSPSVQKFYYLAVAFLTLEESTMSPISLAVYSISHPSQSDDATNLRNLTGIPSLFWALAFSCFALICFRFAIGLFFKAGRTKMIERDAKPRFHI